MPQVAVFAPGEISEFVGPVVKAFFEYFLVKTRAVEADGERFFECRL